MSTYTAFVLAVRAELEARHKHNLAGGLVADDKMSRRLSFEEASRYFAIVGTHWVNTPTPGDSHETH